MIKNNYVEQPTIASFPNCFTRQNLTLFGVLNFD